MINKLTVKQALERGILTRHSDRLGRFFNADLCGSVRFSTAGQALDAFLTACAKLNLPAE
jgi:hypothetical protein